MFGIRGPELGETSGFVGYLLCNVRDKGPRVGGNVRLCGLFAVLGPRLTGLKPDWKKSIHWAKRLEDSLAPKFGKRDFAPKFWNDLR